jgi:hypothetical protein
MIELRLLSHQKLGADLRWHRGGSKDQVKKDVHVRISGLRGDALLPQQGRDQGGGLEGVPEEAKGKLEAAEYLWVFSIGV